MNKGIQVFRVQDDERTWHMTKEEIEESERLDFRIMDMLGFCPKCENFSTESDLKGVHKNKIVCVLCGHERVFKF